MLICQLCRAYRCQGQALVYSALWRTPGSFEYTGSWYNQTSGANQAWCFLHWPDMRAMLRCPDLVDTGPIACIACQWQLHVRCRIQWLCYAQSVSRRLCALAVEQIKDTCSRSSESTRPQRL